LQGIVASVKRVTETVGEIAVASSEQSAGIEQVNTAVTQMDHVTQSNSAQTEELSANAQTLSGQAARLTQLVGRFKLEIAAASRRSRGQCNRVLRNAGPPRWHTLPPTGESNSPIRLPWSTALPPDPSARAFEEIADQIRGIIQPRIDGRILPGE
jgi:outer membrane murein-binding lipoprotein Lpp